MSSNLLADHREQGNKRQSVSKRIGREAMRFNSSRSGISFVRFVAALVVLLLGGSGGTFGQEKPSAKAKEPAANSPAVRSPIAEKVAAEGVKSGAVQREESRGGHEGIKVHGHWTIVVRNADGSVASRNEFENALVTGGRGDFILTGLLSRTLVSGLWAIQLSGAQQLCDVNGSPRACFITELGNGNFTAPNSFPNLVMAAPNGPNSSLSLSGTAKATNSGGIDTVTTMLEACSVSVGTAQCVATQTPIGGLSFTAQTLKTPIAVQAGQSVDVTVVLSFS